LERGCRFNGAYRFDRQPVCIAQFTIAADAATILRMLMKFRFSALVISRVFRIMLATAIVLAIVSSLAAQNSSAPPSAAKRAITEKDLFNFVWIGDPQVSPDGSHAAFTRVVTDEKRTGYETSIWIVATSGNESPMRLTNGKHDAHPRWSPDGKRLAFVRGGEKDDSGKPRPSQIAILPLAGGEAHIITDLPKGAASPVWSPDGKRIAFSSTTTQEDIEKEQRKKKDEKANGANAKDSASAGSPAASGADSDSERESDIHIITRAVYRDTDEGYIDFKRHDHIWVIDVPTTSDEAAKPQQLTSGEYDEGNVLWANDGSRIYFLTSHVDEPYYETGSTDIYSIAASPATSAASSATTTPEKLATVPMDIFNLALSPDGRRVAFHGSVTQPVRSYSQPNLWIMDLTPNAQPRNLTASYDFDMGSAVGGDNVAPRGGGRPALCWSPDGRWIFDMVEKHGHTPLVRVDAQTGAVTEITHGDQAVLGFSITPDARTTVALVSTPVMIGDLFTVSMDESQNGAQTRITDANKTLWSQLNLTAPDEINYKSFDGLPIQGWIQKPPDFDPSKKYPMILNIHGGPHTAYGWVFDHEFQFMAAKGYVVLYINPRGSTSYGQDFGNIIQYHYPGDDYRDLMVGVDEVLKRDYVDPKKLGVTGGSGGGVLTDWTVTQTDRFAAAVSQRDISNWASWWYTADFTLFQPRWFKLPPFQDPKDYANRSAITFVEKIHTPMMFILGQADYRTPQDSGGEQLFRALKFLKRPTAMVVFPRETHELSRSGEPWHRIERLDNIVGWFDKWLMGVPHPEYEVRPETPGTKAAGR
jgi:dipeptidyl aminopeptidase/acylaminoacyl peptidase